MAIEIGALRALLSLDSAAFVKGSKVAKKEMSGLQRRLSQVSGNMRRIGRRMATRVTAPLAASVGLVLRSSLTTIDAQAKLAQSLGTSTRSIQVLARAGELAGVEMAGIEQATKDLTRRLSQAADGTGPAVNALERLGLSAEELLKLSLDQRVARINSAIEEFVPVAQRAAVAGQLFGEEGSLALSRVDAKKIEAATDEIERFGLSVTEIEADKIEEANDAMSALGLVTKGLGNQLAVALAPTLIKIAETVADLAAKFSGLSPRMKSLIATGAALAAAIGPLAIALGFMVSGLAALASPVGLIVIGLSALAGAAAYVASNWSELRERFPGLAKAFDSVKAAASLLWEVLKVQGRVSFEVLAGVVRSLSRTFRGDLRGAMEAIRDIGTNIFAYFRYTFPLALETLTGMIETARQKGQAIVRSIAEGIRSFFGSIGEAFIALKDKIVTELKAIPGQLVEYTKQIGRNIIDGIRDGITGRSSTVGSASRKAARDAAKGFADEAEIKSPSRVFMRLGAQLMQGATIGVNSGAESLAKSAAGAASAAAGAFSRAGVVSGANRLRDSISNIADAMANAAANSQNMGEAISNVFRQIAADYLSSGIRNILGSIVGAIGGSVLAPQTSARPPIRSFDGGGYTWDGPRSGGMDGKGGRLAILHPRETVIDETKGGGAGGVVVNQVINVSTGVAATVRSEIKSLMPQIAEGAKAAVLDGKRRGGAYGRAFG